MLFDLPVELTYKIIFLLDEYVFFLRHTCKYFYALPLEYDNLEIINRLCLDRNSFLKATIRKLFKIQESNNNVLFSNSEWNDINSQKYLLGLNVEKIKHTNKKKAVQKGYKGIINNFIKEPTKTLLYEAALYGQLDIVKFFHPKVKDFCLWALTENALKSGSYETFLYVNSIDESFTMCISRVYHCAKKRLDFITCISKHYPIPQNLEWAIYAEEHNLDLIKLALKEYKDSQVFCIDSLKCPTEEENIEAMILLKNSGFVTFHINLCSLFIRSNQLKALQTLLSFGNIYYTTRLINNIYRNLLEKENVEALNYFYNNGYIPSGSSYNVTMKKNLVTSFCWLNERNILPDAKNYKSVKAYKDSLQI